MTITEQDGRLLVRLSPENWRYFAPGCHAFIEALKAGVPAAERDFNPLSNEWTVPVRCRELIERLRDEHLVDKNQQELF